MQTRILFAQEVHLGNHLEHDRAGKDSESGEHHIVDRRYDGSVEGVQCLHMKPNDYGKQLTLYAV